MTKNDLTKDGCHCSEKEIAEQKGKESSKEKSTVYLATDGVSATPEENEDGSWKVIIQTTVEGEITEDTRVIKKTNLYIITYLIKQSCHLVICWFESNYLYFLTS